MESRRYIAERLMKISCSVLQSPSFIRCRTHLTLTYSSPLSPFHSRLSPYLPALAASPRLIVHLPLSHASPPQPIARCSKRPRISRAPCTRDSKRGESSRSGSGTDLRILTVFFVGKGVDFRLGCRWVVDVSWRVERVISFRRECVWVERDRYRCRCERFDERRVAELRGPECGWRV